MSGVARNDIRNDIRNGVRRFFGLGLLLGLALCLAACAVPESNDALLELNKDSSLSGLKLGMTVEDMQKELGEADAQNPINAGTEYSYWGLDLSVCVSDEQLIRRLTSKNADFKVFDIAVGDDLTAAAAALEDKGYVRDAADGWRFNNNEVQVILLTIDGETIVGFSVEWLS